MRRFECKYKIRLKMRKAFLQRVSIFLERLFHSIPYLPQDKLQTTDCRPTRPFPSLRRSTWPARAEIFRRCTQCRPRWGYTWRRRTPPPSRSPRRGAAGWRNHKHRRRLRPPRRLPPSVLPPPRMTPHFQSGTRGKIKVDDTTKQVNA